MALIVPRLLFNAVAVIVIATALGSSLAIFTKVLRAREPVPVSALLKCGRQENETSTRETPCIIWRPSFVQLLARPELFDGKLVEVVGFVHFEFEGDGIHLHREDAERHRNWNGLGLRLRTDFRNGEIVYTGPAKETCQDTYARVIGRFDPEGFGHMGLSRGTISDVSVCEPINQQR